MCAVPTIRKLDEVVINRIAAGEVIQRPANALKELLENSIDAKASNIQITVKDGGLKFLQILDNGTGIRKEDLGIVCERFTTSKLTKFEDLSTIGTFGFRGEALASISHVAHLTIVTKTSDSAVGYKATYEDSILKGPPKPCAANQGTQITVEDLFYNVITRRKALTNFSEEHAKVADVVSKYAIHYPTVGFSLKKQGDSKSELKTQPNSTTVTNIQTIYGNTVAKELLEIKSNDETLKFELCGQITNVNFSHKKLIFLLFINNRLVNSTPLKKVLEQIYQSYLPKNSHPFVYISLCLDPRNVDVNVHPTKHEVHFLHEEAILEKIRSIIEQRLSMTNSSRIYYTQSKLPTTFDNSSIKEAKQEKDDTKTYAHHMVRTDAAEQKLDKFFKVPNVDNERESAPVAPGNEFKKRDIKLKSILQLRADVENDSHSGLRDIIKNNTFVGIINPKQCLIQSSTKLYLCNTKKLLEEFFYQVILFEFANFGLIRFSNPISIKELAKLALDSNECGWKESDGPKEDICNSVSELFVEKSGMLEDYFSIEVTENGDLCSIPLLLDQHMPDINILPLFVVRLATEVDWQVEKPCLEGISREIAMFYSEISDYEEESLESESSEASSSWKWTTEHVLFPALKSTLQPPTCFSQDSTILQIANLPDLYKVFERC